MSFLYTSGEVNWRKYKTPVQLSEIAQLKKQVNLEHLTNRIRFKLRKLFQKSVVRTEIDIYVFIKGLGLGLCCLSHFQQYFSYIVDITFIGGGNRRNRRTPPTLCLLRQSHYPPGENMKSTRETFQPIYNIHIANYHIICWYHQLKCYLSFVSSFQTVSVINLKIY